MKVKTSNVFAAWLRDHLKSDHYAVSLEKLSENDFSILVDYFTIDHEIDYNYKTGKFNVIKISYPYEYYAMPLYLTTKELIKIFQTSDKTEAGYLKAIKEYIEI